MTKIYTIKNIHVACYSNKSYRNPFQKNLIQVVPQLSKDFNLSSNQDSRHILETYLAGIYLFNSTLETPARYQWCDSHVGTVNFEQVLVFPSLILNKQVPTI